MGEKIIDHLEMQGIKNLVNLASEGDLDPSMKYFFVDYHIPAFLKVIPLSKIDICGYCDKQINIGEGMIFSLAIIEGIRIAPDLLSMRVRRKGYVFHYSHFR